METFYNKNLVINMKMNRIYTTLDDSLVNVYMYKKTQSNSFETLLFVCARAWSNRRIHHKSILSSIKYYAYLKLVKSLQTENIRLLSWKVYFFNFYFIFSIYLSTFCTLLLSILKHCTKIISKPFTHSYTHRIHRYILLNHIVTLIRKI